MTQEVATLVFAAIMGIGVLAWLCSLTLTLKLGRPTEAPSQFTIEDERRHDVITGELTVRASAEAVLQQLASTLRQPNVGMPLTLFKVIEKSPRRLVVKKKGPLLCNQPPTLYFSEAEFDVEPVGGDEMRVSYVLGFDRLTQRLKRTNLGLILGLGLPVLLLVGGLVSWFILPTENPALRWQVLQTMQIAHVLWPPFLVLGLRSMGRRQSQHFIEGLIQATGSLD
ncbi:MAG: hypothetical protein AAGF31_11620 [Planctomycetota bacterium]